MKYATTSFRTLCADLGFVAGTALVAGSVLPACVPVEPRGDLASARQLISTRVGVEDVYDPEADELVSAKIDALVADGLTVDEAIAVALLNNPQFQSIFAEICVSRADLVQSSLWTNPTLSLGLQFPEGGGLTDVTVGFAQQVADLWQIPVRKGMAQAELQRTILIVGQRAVELVADVRMRCYRVLALEEATRYYEENLRLVERAVALTDAQFRAGDVSEFEVNLARTGVFDVQEELISTRGQLQQARADLAEVLGLSTRLAEVRLIDALPAEPPTQPTEQDLLELALDARFDIRVAWFAVQRAEAALRLEHRRFFPDVQLGFAFERSEQRALPGRKVLADTARSSIAAGQLTVPSIQSRGERSLQESQIIDAKLGPTLALALPIFDQNQAQIAKASVRVLQARKDYAARVNAVAAEVQRTFAAARAAEQVLHLQRESGLPQAEATVAGAEERFQAGEESILVLIEAQDALVKRRRAHVTALRDYAVALAQLEGAVGGRSLLAGAESVTLHSPAEKEER